ncbi:beta-glucosidase [Asanoa ishikariensis]|uniref:Beta-glucosidase n=1 Tax=Asanoa ishikariensis TaxID=137265 RepID=A0A1H3TN73_9ACTN|nr:GH1 family beta-glucosidase [Asanoa ishikariensis]GIF62128.1 beta-glucosidase [Asanoa ishikariensis]SDZ51457.1 broad-specificity cellobiase [Asanoa ishikariensis]
MTVPTRNAPDRSVAPLEFPAGFRWGAATAAFQVEGALDVDGRGASVWDTFTSVPGRVANEDRADLAVDHYRRYRDDVALMAELGLGTYRFSVSWPRVQRNGRGAGNPKGLDFYSRLVDELLSRGIEPMLTLYHWDHPQALQDIGGWARRDMAERFADYAALVGARLGDRVPLWTTLNEPWCTAFLGHASGIHAPGIAHDATALRVVHHLNLAHGLAVAALRATLPATAQVSIALNPAPVRTPVDTVANRDAVRRADALRNRVFLDPLLRGAYPADLIADTAHVTDWGFVRDGDLATVTAPIDLLGVNYYTPLYVAAGPGPADPYNRWIGSEGLLHVASADGPSTIHGTVDPGALRELLNRIRHDYGPVPIVIAENGVAFPDRVGPDGSVADPGRIAYVHAHLAALHDAIADGVDVRGYMMWSLIDNFEWVYGYGQPFGLVHVDRATQHRTIKNSGHWYRNVIAANALPPLDPPAAG